MPKTPDHHIQETTGTTLKPKRVQLETVPGSGTDAVAKELSSVHAAILQDANISQKGVGQLDQTLGELTIDVGGIPIPIAEVPHIPDLQMNAKIWQEIMAGKYNNHGQMTYLPPQVATELANRLPTISLNNITSLSDATVQCLAKHQGSSLELDGLTKLSQIAAQYLAQHKGYGLSLRGLISLPDTTAQYFEKHEGALCLRLTSLSDVAVQYLARSPSFLALGLTSLPDTTARLLAQHQNGLRLDRLTEISDTAARYFADCPGELLLRSLRTLTDTAALYLAQHRGPLSLTGLTTLSDKATELFATYRKERKGYLEFRREIQEKVDSFKPKN